MKVKLIKLFYYFNLIAIFYILDGPLPSVLQEVTVPVIKNDICESMYRNAGYIEHIPHIFICAGHKQGSKDSCEGDSGGKLMRNPFSIFFLTF